MKSETFHDRRVAGTNFGIYSIVDNKKKLVIYREGKKDRKNIAEIIEITSSRMTLVDISGTGDTMKLKKID